MPTKRPRIGDEADEMQAGDQSAASATAGARPRRRPESEATHDNRRRLGVDQEHRTETMRRRRRGTFP